MRREERKYHRKGQKKPRTNRMSLGEIGGAHIKERQKEHIRSWTERNLKSTKNGGHKESNERQI